MDARQRGARPRARAGGALRLLLRPPPGRAHPPEALRRPEPRPHHPQGRPHRHRDHEPPHRAGVAAAVHPRRSRSTGRSSCCATTADAWAARCCSTSAAARFVVVRARATLLAMGGGPTMYRVIACSADKSADGIALGLRAGVRAARHGDGAVPSDRAHRAQLAHDRRAARGGAARRGRPAPQRPRRALHGSATTPRAWSARPATSSRAPASPRCSRAAARPTAACGSTSRISGAEVVERSFRGMVKRCRDFGRDLAREPVEVGPTAHFMMGGIVDRPRLPHRRGGALRGRRGHRRRARRQPARRQRRRRVHRVRRHRRRRDGGLGGRAGPLPRCRRARVDAAVAAATAPLARGDGGESLYDLQARLRAGHVGARRPDPRPARASSWRWPRSRTSRAGSRSVAVRGGGAYNLAWQDWLNLRNQATAALAHRAQRARAHREPRLALPPRLPGDARASRWRCSPASPTARAPRCGPSRCATRGSSRTRRAVPTTVDVGD